MTVGVTDDSVGTGHGEALPPIEGFGGGSCRLEAFLPVTQAAHVHAPCIVRGLKQTAATYLIGSQRVYGGRCAGGATEKGSSRRRNHEGRTTRAAAYPCFFDAHKGRTDKR